MLNQKEIPRINGNMLVIRENSLARAAMNLTTAEHRLVSVLSSLITPNDTAGKIYRFAIKDYCNFFNLTEDGNHTQLQKIFLSLRKKAFAIDRNGKTHITGWINTATIIHGQGIVEITIDERILPFLLYINDISQIGINKEIGYIKHKLATIKYFSSAYAFNLYNYAKTLLINKLNIKIDLTIEEIRNILIVDEKKYSQVTGLKNRALIPAIAEINGDIDLLIKYRSKNKIENSEILPSDINIKFNDIKRGKVIIGISLEIKKNEFLENNIELNEMSKIKSKLKEYGYSKNDITKILNGLSNKEYNTENCIKNALYAITEEKKRKKSASPILNLVSYAIYCIKNNIANNIDLKEKPKEKPLVEDFKEDNHSNEKIDFLNWFDHETLIQYFKEYIELNKINYTVNDIYVILQSKNMSKLKLNIINYLMQKRTQS